MSDRPGPRQPAARFQPGQARLASDGSCSISAGRPTSFRRYDDADQRALHFSHVRRREGSPQLSQNKNGRCNMPAADWEQHSLRDEKVAPAPVVLLYADPIKMSASKPRLRRRNTTGVANSSRGNYGGFNDQVAKSYPGCVMAISGRRGQTIALMQRNPRR
jgi:hypothetical protein